MSQEIVGTEVKANTVRHLHKGEQSSEVLSTCHSHGSRWETMLGTQPLGIPGHLIRCFNMEDNESLEMWAQEVHLGTEPRSPHAQPTKLDHAVALCRRGMER
ncbi:PCTP-like protein [Platysternon megacephalum]|uniref:PCTP-like protein n=1 Tax=Platysternon megacephalum TaxID=55544 RepID=A0A4D9E3U4_9SAUR|nr:PCTP-like protein [Platysternon megacephalum]